MPSFVASSWFNFFASLFLVDCVTLMKWNMLHSSFVLTAPIAAEMRVRLPHFRDSNEIKKDGLSRSTGSTTWTPVHVASFSTDAWNDMQPNFHGKGLFTFIVSRVSNKCLSTEGKTSWCYLLYGLKKGKVIISFHKCRT